MYFDVIRNGQIYLSTFLTFYYLAETNDPLHDIVIPKIAVKNSVVTIKWTGSDSLQNIRIFTQKRVFYENLAFINTFTRTFYKWTVNIPEGVYYLTINDVESNFFAVTRNDTKVQNLRYQNHVYTCIP
ncbi:11238_t:CDS:2 [Acaulospora morrowiae]|uniref:11238_t:CDS:1 n=1 Tax=Acaulospora morrowiae TaxID=94023 RepID=A0A9N8ZSV4_9GLOM|nr:11238_t:CDS:2 [Acaulospora morrowiae]